MGCGFIKNNKKPIITKKKKVYDYNFSKIEEAAIGAYFFRKKSKASSHWEKIFSKSKYSVVPFDSLIIDIKLFNKLRKLILKGPPPEHRWVLWSKILNSQISEIYPEISIQKNASEEVILKDIYRTFPEYPYFDKEKYGYYGQYALYRILGKFSTQYPKVGYCQGMNYIIGFLLMISGGLEQEVYSIFVCLCKEFNLFEFFCEEMHELHKNLWIFDKIFKEYFPKLYSHFIDQEIMEDMWIFKWMLSMYTSCLPLKTVARIWDLIVIKGLKAVFQAALGIISLLETKLLNEDMTEILKSFNELTEKKLTTKEIIKSMKKIKLKRGKIEKLRREYDDEQKINIRASQLNLPLIIKSDNSIIPKNMPPVAQIIVQEITETLDDLPPFKTHKSGYSTPYRTNHNNQSLKVFDYYKMGRISFIDDRNNEDDAVNAESLLDDLISDKYSGDSFIVRAYENNK